MFFGSHSESNCREQANIPASKWPRYLVILVAFYKSETGVVSRGINQATKYAYAKYWQNALTFEMYCKYITSKPNGFLNGMQKLPLKFIDCIIFLTNFATIF